MKPDQRPIVFPDGAAVVFAFATPGTEVQVHMTPSEAARVALDMFRTAMRMPGMSRHDATEIKAALEAAAISH